jgi:hypothetical protein
LAHAEIEPKRGANGNSAWTRFNNPICRFAPDHGLEIDPRPKLPKSQLCGHREHHFR